MREVTFGISSYLIPPHLPAQLVAAGYAQAELQLHATPDRYALHEAVSRFATAVSRLHLGGMQLFSVRLPDDAAWDIALEDEGESRSNLAALAYLLDAAGQFAAPAVCLQPYGGYGGDAARRARLQRSLQLLDRAAVSATTTLCLEVTDAAQLRDALVLTRGFFATRLCPAVDAADADTCALLGALPPQTVGALRITNAAAPCTALATLWADVCAAGYEGPLLVDVPLTALEDAPALLGVLRGALQADQ